MERGVQTGAHIGQEERRTCMAAIEVRHLYKRFEQKGVTVEALSDINLTVEQGDLYGIIGMAGAGKSTPVSYTHLDVYKRQVCVPVRSRWWADTELRARLARFWRI